MNSLKATHFGDSLLVLMGILVLWAFPYFFYNDGDHTHIFVIVAGIFYASISILSNLFYFFPRTSSHYEYLLPGLSNLLLLLLTQNFDRKIDMNFLFPASFVVGNIVLGIIWMRQANKKARI